MVFSDVVKKQRSLQIFFFFFACPKITLTVSCYPWEVLTKTTACRLHLKGTVSRDVVCKMWPSISVLDPRVIGNVIGATT